CAIQGRFISARMITQLAAYGSFINDQSVAYNKSASEHVFHVIQITLNIAISQRQITATHSGECGCPIYD
ncbi:hypothetical protein, partial [Klebsiella pneumoniae]|uniref:hypothetical protein n=1 Tax=Klebsiella pneumoniae TaxID=573 RepID=UPI003EDF82BD